MTASSLSGLVVVDDSLSSRLTRAKDRERKVKGVRGSQREGERGREGGDARPTRLFIFALFAGRRPADEKTTAPKGTTNAHDIGATTRTTSQLEKGKEKDHTEGRKRKPLTSLSPKKRCTRVPTKREREKGGSRYAAQSRKR